MSNPLELIVKNKNEIYISHPDADRIESFRVGEDEGLGKKVFEFCLEQNIKADKVVFLLAEELLYFKKFELPQQTHNLKEAVGYQLEMLVPFPEESLLYSFSSVREKELIKITLVATQRHIIDHFLDEITRAGYTVVGIFPENQKYVTKETRKGTWVLIIPGRISKGLVFSGNKLKERVLLYNMPSFEELAELCGTDNIYHLDPPAEEEAFKDVQKLLGQKPTYKDFNMLPQSLRRPDYLKYAIMFLAALNVIALLSFFGSREYRLRSYASMVNNEIEQLAPQVSELKRLHKQEQVLEGYLGEVDSIGRNPDLMGFFKNLTDQLPVSAYLDQMRMDKNNSSIHIQGFTDDISELTSKLQEMGEAKLKSTSRRKSQTYFNVEINLP